ncbi:MAG: efflux RND transporter permease subunit [Verrucomicrobiota bacterium]
MLQAIVQFSLRFRGVVVALACLLLAFGLYVARNAKLDVFPDFVPPQVVIQTEAPGLSPEQVEALVTRPVETAVNGLGNQEAMRSESIQGLSIITVVFKEGTEIYTARQMLAEKLTAVVGQLPAGVRTPKMSPLTSSTMDMLKVGMLSDKMSPMELRTFADWTVRPRLLAVPGVAKCSVFGGDVRQWQIQVDPEKLRARGVALTDILAAARAATGVQGAGFIENQNQRVLLQTEGQTLDPEILGGVVVAHRDGQSVLLRDLARVVEGVEPKFGDSLIMGKPGILLTMSSQYGANTMEVTRELEVALEELKPVFKQEGITLYPRLHRPATFIETALTNMKGSLALGGILVAVVLFILLGSIRTALISITAIPLSLLTAVIILDKLGITLNTITLGGLAIALGEVVDDSIIDVENIFRRLRENRALAQPRPAFAVVLDASLEVRRAVVFATFVVVLVFLPVLTLTGLQGSFFAPLAQSYILAILASLVMALTLTPALAFLFFGRGVRSLSEPWLQRMLKAAYGWILKWILRVPSLLIILVAAACVWAVTRLPQLGGEFLPEFREGHFVLQVSTAPGTSLPEMMRLGKQLAAALLAHPKIDTVEQQIGRAEQGEDPWGPHRSEFHVELKRMPAEEEEKMSDEIRKILGEFPGIQFEVLTFLGDRIGESISGETAQVVVSLFGDDFDLLDEKGAEVAQVLQTVKGARDVQVKSPPGSPRLTIRLRFDRLSQFGMRPVEVLEAIQTAYQGTVAAQTYRGNQVTDLAVIMADSFRRDPESVGTLMLRNSQGLSVPLSEVAEIEMGNGRFSILREGARRRQTVTCNVENRDIETFVAEARESIRAKVTLPHDLYLNYSGAAEAQQKARHQLLLHSAIAAVGILLLLAVAFRSWRNLLLVLCNLPFALVGGVLTLWLCKKFGESGTLSIGALVGFVTLFGITMRNSIMMISHFENLVKNEGMTWGVDAALRGASERLMPILMTATVTALGLLPLALGAGEAGREIEGPMAMVILGGLATSTLLNLLVLPTLALHFAKFNQAE